MRNLYYIISGEEYLKGVDNIESYLEWLFFMLVGNFDPINIMVK